MGCFSEKKMPCVNSSCCCAHRKLLLPNIVTTYVEITMEKWVFSQKKSSQKLTNKESQKKALIVDEECFAGRLSLLNNLMHQLLTA